MCVKDFLIGDWGELLFHALNTSLKENSSSLIVLLQNLLGPEMIGLPCAKTRGYP
jgi:hypothetical protein